MADQLLRAGFRFYQSANADAESIKEGFIIRQHEYEIIMEDIRRNSRERSVQHYLLLGRRGSGKSTLLRRIQIEIDTDEEIRKSYIAINLAEEQANIYRLSDLWEDILQELDHAGLTVYHPEWEEDVYRYSHNLIEAAHTAIHTSGKKVVLLLDNIDRIFENLKADAALLREYLLNFDDLKIIGGSTRMTEHFWMYDQPFYEFFRVINLNPLNSTEVKTLLLFWAEKLNQPELKTFVETQAGQLETIRILTDGLPRTLQFFVNILLNRTQETGYEYLRLIMDQVTPLYQERLNNLPPAQRKIVLQMAFIWEATGTKELATAAHMNNSVVSAQLKQLNEKSIVETVKTDNKNHLYRIAERFFNLWLIFTQGSPHEKRKARYLTIFLENFYSVDDLKKLTASHLATLQNGSLEANKAALISKALAQSRYITLDERDDLIRYTMDLKSLNRDLKQQLPLLTDDIFKKIEVAVDNKDWHKALRLTTEIEQDDSLKWNFVGYIYHKKNDFIAAEKYYLIAIGQMNVAAMYNLGILCHEQLRLEEAEKYYLLAIEHKDGRAMSNLGVLYFDKLRFEDAEKYYLMAIEHENVSAIYNLGNLYFSQSRFLDAEKYYLIAIEQGHVNAMNNLGYLYSDQSRLIDAEKYYLMAVEHKNGAAMNNLGNLYYNQLKLEEAEKYYLMAVEQHGYANASHNLALLYYSLNKNKQDAKELIEAFGSNDKIGNINFIKAIINLWVGEVTLAISIVLAPIKTETSGVKTSLFNDWRLKQFLIHHQTNFVLTLFDDEDFGKELTERFQPIFYAASIIAERDKNIELKIPPEIKETVDSIIDEIKERQQFYYGN